MSSGWVASERLVEHGAGRVEVGLVAGVVGGCAAATCVSARIDRMQLEAPAVVGDPGGFALVEDAEAHLDGAPAQKAPVDLYRLAVADVTVPQRKRVGGLPAKPLRGIVGVEPGLAGQALAAQQATDRRGADRIGVEPALAPQE